MKFYQSITTSASISSNVSFLLLVWLVTAIKSDDPNGNDMIGMSATDIVRLRKFIAEEHYVITTDGYVLKLVRVVNPLITGGKSGMAGKEPLLMLHGITTAGGIFISNSINARPKDFRHLNVSGTSEEALSKLLQDEPVSNSLAFLASCFGRDVWILNRRGTAESRGQQLDVSISPKYWNYSLDEQAKYDVPEVVDYVLNSTGSNKLDIVGHSAGGALILMALASQPDLARKLSHTLLWAPALYLGPANPFSEVESVFFRSFIGPTPPLYLIPIIQGLYVTACQSKLSRRTLCAAYVSHNFGSGGHQQNLRPGFFNEVPSAISSHDYSQLGQAQIHGKMCTFDFGSAAKNMEAHGHPEPILYDVAKINSTPMSFWYGNTDSLVEYSNVEKLIGDLADLSVKKHFLNATDLYFNHLSFFFHKNVSQLLNIPALKTIETQSGCSKV